MESIEPLLSALRAVAEPTRLRLLALCAHGELTVSELVGILGQSQPRVSRHLKLLTDAGLLERIREGSWVFHRQAQQGAAAHLVEQLNDMLPDHDATLARDLERLSLVKNEREQAAADYFRRNAESWDRLRSLHVDDSVVERVMLDMLEEYQIDELLDVGTGTGRMLELFGGRLIKGVGIDLSREMLGVARVKLERAGLDNCTVRQAEMYQIPFQARTFDLVTLHQVLHFLDRPGQALGEAARVLKAGGLFLLVDFTPHNEENLRDEHAHRRLGFDDAEVATWFKACGISMSKIEYLKGNPLTVAIWLGKKIDSENSAL